MTAVTLAKTLDMPRDEWLELRRQGIGGSDVAAIAGLSPWRSPVAVWLEKTGQLEPDDPGEAAYWGRRLEDVVADEFTERNNLKVRRCNQVLQHPKYPFMLANIDRRIVGRKAGLEVKTTSAYKKEDWNEGKIPDFIAIQCHHYMAVTGFKEWHVAVLIGGQEYRDGVVKRDEEIIRYLREIESTFWRLVEEGTPPEMDGSSASEELLNRLYPAEKTRPEEVNLPPDAKELLRQYDEAAEQLAFWEERQKEAKNKLKELLGEYEVGWAGDRKVSWKTVTSSRLDSKRLKKELPEVFEKYSAQNSYRRFLI